MLEENTVLRGLHWDSSNFDKASIEELGKIRPESSCMVHLTLIVFRKETNGTFGAVVPEL